MGTLLQILGLVALTSGPRAPAKGTYARALADAKSCDTPAAWIAVDDRDNGPPWYYAVCGTADGLICGEDVSWASLECASPEDARE